MYKLVDKITRERVDGIISPEPSACWQTRRGIAEWEQIPAEPPTIDAQAAQIEANYKLKIDAYLNLILIAIGADGSSQAGKIATYQAKISELKNQMNDEMEELYNA